MNKSVCTLSVALLVLIVIGLFPPQSVFGQTEKMGIVTYTPPKGWIKDSKVENVIVFSEANKTALGKFCVITLYGAIESTGDAAKDFDREWNNIAVKPFKAAAPRKLLPKSFEGWTVISGGSKIEYQGRDTTLILTMFSGFGKTVSVFAIADNKSYKPQIEAFVAGIGIDKPDPTAAPKHGNNL